MSGGSGGDSACVLAGVAAADLGIGPIGRGDGDCSERSLAQWLTVGGAIGGVVGTGWNFDEKTESFLTALFGTTRIRLKYLPHPAVHSNEIALARLRLLEAIIAECTRAA